MKSDTTIRIDGGKPWSVRWVQHTVHIATIFFLFFPFSHSESCQSVLVVSGGDWGVRTVLSRSNLGSMEWGSRPQGKNGWVATSWKKKQTNTTLPVYVYTIGQSQKSFTSWAIIQVHSTSALPVITLKSGFMASNTISTILNHTKQGVVAFHHSLQYHPRPFVFFSSSYLWGDFESWIDVLQVQWAILA